MSNGVVVSVEESAVWGHTAAERPIYPQSYRMVGENGVLSVGFGNWTESHQQAELYVVSGKKQWTEKVSADKAWDDTYRQFFKTILGEPVDHRFVADGHDALTNMRVAREVIAQCTTKRTASTPRRTRKHGTVRTKHR
jgi:predicted dehydrogenase